MRIRMLCVHEGREEDKGESGGGGRGSGGTEPSAPIMFRDIFKDERADLSLDIAWLVVPSVAAVVVVVETDLAVTAGRRYQLARYGSRGSR